MTSIHILNRGPSLLSQVMLPPPRPLEPPVLLGLTNYDTILNRRTAFLTEEGSASRLHLQFPAEVLPERGIQLPAIRSTVSLPLQHDQGIPKIDVHVQNTAKQSSPSYPGRARVHPPLREESSDGTRANSLKTPELIFAELLIAGSDMETVLDAMSQEISPQDVLDILRMDLARPPMPEEPVSDPDYKPRSSRSTRKAPPDVQHCKNETKRRAQHKHYLDLSELTIPDFFLKMCGWDEPGEGGSKRTPRTKSSILQAGCLYMWFSSGPVLRCFKSLLHSNQHLEEKVKHLQTENQCLLLRCQSLQSQAQVKTEHIEAATLESPIQLLSLTNTRTDRSPCSSARSLEDPTLSHQTGFASKHNPMPPALCDHPTRRTQLKSRKRRRPTVLLHVSEDPASPLKRRKTNSEFVEKWDSGLRLAFGHDGEHSFRNIECIKDRNRENVNAAPMYRQGLSSAPSSQSVTTLCWDSASVVSTSSSWDVSSPQSIAHS